MRPFSKDRSNVDHTTVLNDKPIHYTTWTWVYHECPECKGVGSVPNPRAGQKGTRKDVLQCRLCNGRGVKGTQNRGHEITGLVTTEEATDER